MKKIVSILCACLALAACDNQKSDKPVVRIGVTLPLTGALSETAKAAQASMNMALKKWKLKKDI